MISCQSKIIKIFAVFFAICVLFCISSIFVFADEQITDLTGTTWVVNSVLTSGQGLEISSLDGQPICVVEQDSPSLDFVIEPDVIFLGGNSVGEPELHQVLFIHSEPYASAELVSGAKITFYDTSASTDEDLILFMQENATLQIDEPEVNPDEPEVATFNLFDTCYDLIVQYVFAGQGVQNGVLVDQMQHLVATLVATFSWIFCMAVPFIVTYWVIKVICTGFGRW